MTIISTEMLKWKRNKTVLGIFILTAILGIFAVERAFSISRSSSLMNSFSDLYTLAFKNLSVLFYLLLFGITFLVEVILHFRGLSIKMILSFFKIYLLDGIGIFFAIAPVIAVVSRIKKGYWLALIFTVIYSFAGLFTSISDVLSACYPITATFNISGYYSATFGEIIISLMSLFFCGLFSVLILISKKTIKNK